ncbi:MAG TPA: glycosyltransferase family 4 protein [Pyrinomonadaceae bacterium]|jgi:glycosyltransferase involved in cell wall biosynthesis
MSEQTENLTSETNQPRLRVLLVAPSLDMLGGQSRQCARLRGHLENEPTLDVAFQAVNPRLPGPFRQLQRIKYVRTILTTLLYWVQLVVRAARYDVLHVFSASYYSYMLSAMPAILIGKLYGKKVILNYRSGEAEDHLQNWRTAIPTIRMADVVVVPSGYLVDVFARFGLKAQAISNIVELDRFQFRDRRPLRPVFLTSRLLEPLYNVGCVLRAFALIQKEVPEASLTVAGEGWMRSELEQLARDLELRNIEFIGGVPFKDMPAMYDSADVYLTATDLDNMPSSIVECLAAGLPVVTTDAGGIPYIVTHEETCLMIARNDHEAMAAAALRFLRDEELASRIAHNAREHCRNFSWPVVQKEWLKLYHQIARGPLDITANTEKLFVEARTETTNPQHNPSPDLGT